MLGFTVAKNYSSTVSTLIYLSYELELWVETLSMTELGRASSSGGWEGTTVEKGL
jgi:hypothetical protein